jgi:hypothetical protein
MESPNNLVFKQLAGFHERTGKEPAVRVGSLTQPRSLIFFRTLVKGQKPALFIFENR